MVVASAQELRPEPLSPDGTVWADAEPCGAGRAAEDAIGRQCHPSGACWLSGATKRLAERSLLALIPDGCRWMFEQHELGPWRQRARQVHTDLLTGREG
jgi:hypothetical protein